MGGKEFNKEIYKGIFNFDKKISLILSFVIITASSIGLFFISQQGGITGFSIFEITGNGMGIMPFILLFLAIIFALVNIAYLGKKSRKI